MIWWIVSGGVVAFLAWQHHLEKKAVERFHKRWEEERMSGKLSAGACYLTPHDLGHWRGNLYAKWDMFHMTLKLKHPWLQTFEMKIRLFVKPITYEKNGKITEGWRFLPWTRKVTGRHSGSFATFN